MFWSLCVMKIASVKFSVNYQWLNLTAYDRIGMAWQKLTGQINSLKTTSMACKVSLYHKPVCVSQNKICIPVACVPQKYFITAYF